MACNDYVNIFLPTEHLGNTLAGLSDFARPDPSGCTTEIVFPDQTVTIPFNVWTLTDQGYQRQRIDATAADRFCMDLEIPFKIDEVLHDYLEGRPEFGPSADAPSITNLPFSCCIRPSVGDSPGVSSLSFYAVYKFLAPRIPRSQSMCDTFTLFALEHDAECCAICNDCGSNGTVLMMRGELMAWTVGSYFDKYQPLLEEVSARRRLEDAGGDITRILALLGDPNPAFRAALLRQAQQLKADASVFVHALSDDDPSVAVMAVTALGQIGGDDAIQALNVARSQHPELCPVIASAIEKIRRKDWVSRKDRRF